MKNASQFDPVESIEAIAKCSTHYRKSGSKTTYCNKRFKRDPIVLTKVGLSGFHNIVHGVEADYEGFLKERGNGEDCSNPYTQRDGFLDEYQPNFHPDPERRPGKEMLN